MDHKEFDDRSKMTSSNHLYDSNHITSNTNFVNKYGNTYASLIFINPGNTNSNNNNDPNTQPEYNEAKMKNHKTSRISRKLKKN